MHPNSTTEKHLLPAICSFCGRAFFTRSYKVRMGYRVCCGRACAARVGRPDTNSRFWAKVNKNGPVPVHRPELGQCWLWTGRPRADGYGRFGSQNNGRSALLAHRAAYLFTYGVIPDGAFICHHCDNRGCVRPSHLFTGNQLDNMQDAASKGRMASGARHNSKANPATVLRGEKHGSHKLTETQVRQIRAEYAIGDTSERKLAKAHAVTRGAIRRVLDGTSWLHVT